MKAMTSALGCAVLATLAGIGMAHYASGGAIMPLRQALLRLVVVASPATRLPTAAAAIPVAGGGGTTLTLDPDAYGQFHAEMEVEGRRVPALVDTGASLVALSDSSAATLGFYPAPADFTLTLSTANGTTRAAPVVIRELRLGPLVGRNVSAVVMQHGALTTSALLGMSFLKGLSGVSIREGRLVLVQ